MEKIIRAMPNFRPSNINDLEINKLEKINEKLIIDKQFDHAEADFD